MKLINLIPQDIQEAGERHRTIFMLTVAVVLAVGVTGAGWFVCNEVATTVVNDVTIQPSASPTATPDPNGSQESRDRTDLIKRTSALNTLAQGEVNWAATFSLVKSLIPKEVLLSATSYTQVPDGVTAQITGSATSNLAFASFIQGLKQDIRLSKVIVDSFAFDPKAGTVQFSITLSLPNKNVLYQAPATTGKAAS